MIEGIGEHAVILCHILGKLIQKVLVDTADHIAAHIVQRIIVEDAQQFPSSSSEKMV